MTGIQVFEGDGTASVAQKYRRPVWFTKVLLEEYAKDNPLASKQLTYGVVVNLMSLIDERTDTPGDLARNIMAAVANLRYAIKGTYRGSDHPLRQMACVAENEWKVAIETPDPPLPWG
jgi:hypothetical protein